MSSRSSLHRPLATAVAIAALAHPAAAQTPAAATVVASAGSATPLTRSVAVPPVADTLRGARPRLRIRKEPAAGLVVDEPRTVFEYVLTPPELQPPELRPLAAAPFEMPRVGAAPGGGSRWLWILPLGMLPFFHGHGGGGEQQPAEVVLPPVTPPVTPPVILPVIPTSPPTITPEIPPLTPPLTPPELPPTTTVPEPGTLGLLGAGLAMAGVVARRRRAR